MQLTERVHPTSGLRYLDLCTERWIPAVTVIGIPCGTMIGRLHPAHGTDVLVKFIDEQRLGNISMELYFKASTLQQIWATCLTSPSWNAFRCGDRVMATSAGIILGMLPTLEALQAMGR